MIPITKIFESYLGQSIEDYAIDKALKSYDFPNKTKDINRKFKWLSVDVQMENSKESVDISDEYEIKDLKTDVENITSYYEEALLEQIRRTIYVLEKDLYSIIEIYFNDNTHLFDVGERLLMFDGLSNKDEYSSQLNELAKSNDNKNKQTFYQILIGLTNDIQ